MNPPSKRRMSREERELTLEFGGIRAARLIVAGEAEVCISCGAIDECTCQQRRKRGRRKAPTPVTAQPADRPMRDILDREGNVIGRTTAGADETLCPGDP